MFVQISYILFLSKSKFWYHLLQFLIQVNNKLRLDMGQIIPNLKLKYLLQNLKLLLICCLIVKIYLNKKLAKNFYSKIHFLILLLMYFFSFSQPSLSEIIKILKKEINCFFLIQNQIEDYNLFFLKFYFLIISYAVFLF